MELYETLCRLVREVEDDMKKATGGNKAAGTRVRKSMQDIKDCAQQIRAKVLEMRDTMRTELQLVGALMLPGMTFTIEPMLTLGSIDYVIWDDRWTVVTRDLKRTAQFEHTLLVTDTGAEILTLA